MFVERETNGEINGSVYDGTEKEVVCVHARTIVCGWGCERERERAKEGGKERDMGVYTEGQRKTGV